MQRGRLFTDYEPVLRSPGRRPLFEPEVAAAEVCPLETKPATTAAAESESAAPPQTKAGFKLSPMRGHAVTYLALFFFTFILYARPAELYPSPWTMKIAFYSGVVLLLCYVPSQLIAEGTPTVLLPEIKIILLFGLTALISIPVGMNPSEGLATFSDAFIRCIFIFIIMINVVRTEWRLKGLLLLALAASCWLSLGALHDYHLGLMTVEGYRVGGRGTGIFGNSNDLALHLVTMVPIAIALLFATRGPRKIVYGVVAILIIAAIILTFSRGGFLALLISLGVMGWKIGRRHKLPILLLAVTIAGFFLLFAPGNYSIRLISIFIPSLDPVGSSTMRSTELVRSLIVAARHPVFGIGMGNYASGMSLSGLVTHNAYTQVASEMGATALVLYVMLMVYPFRRLRQIERETFDAHSRYHYLAIGLQASLVAYMVSSFFASVAYLWYVYYLVAYAVCLRRIYEADTGTVVILERTRLKEQKKRARRAAVLAPNEGINKAVTT
jgi:putative inorganic carbon (hco3(-)) transporter